MVTPSDTMAASLKLEIRQRVDLSRYFMVGHYLPRSHFRFYLKHIFWIFVVQGDDKEFFKFRIGSQEVRSFAIYMRIEKERKKTRQPITMSEED